MKFKVGDSVILSRVLYDGEDVPDEVIKCAGGVFTVVTIDEDDLEGLAYLISTTKRPRVVTWAYEEELEETE